MNSAVIQSNLMIPARIELIEPSLDYAEKLALAYSFDPAEAAKIRLAIEEALHFGITHFFEGANDAEARLELRFEISPAAYHCIIMDKGLPFDINAFPGYETASDPEQLEIDGLGIFLIRRLMDEMTLVNRGRDGKEWHLVKKKSGQHINQLIAGQEEQHDTTALPVGPVELHIRRFEAADALAVARLAYRTYGYGYEDFIYYPQELIRMNEEATLLSLVAVVEPGELAGHVGIYVLKESPGLVEWRAGFVNPAFRQHKVFHQLMKRMDEEGCQLGFLGAFGRAVGGHLVSQKELINNGMKSCGILLAAFPANVEFKALTGVIPSRFHAALKYKQFHSGHRPRLFIPEQHRSMITSIYEHIGRDFETGAISGDERAISACTAMFAHRETVLNTVDIKAWEYGPNVLNELKSQWHFNRLEHNDVIYLYLNLEDPYTPELVSYFENLGFFFGGILPDGLYSQDTIILQYLNNLAVDYQSIDLYCPFARQILDYVKIENRRALSQNL